MWIFPAGGRRPSGKPIFCNFFAETVRGLAVILPSENQNKEPRCPYIPLLV